MKLVTFRADGAVRTGVVADGLVFDVSATIAAREHGPEILARALATGAPPAPSGMLRLLQGGREALLDLRAGLASGKNGLASFSLGDVTLLAPVPRPGKVVGVGRNYAEHARELGSAVAELPRIIMKFPTTATGPGADIHIPRSVTRPDYEVEIAVVMGAFARDVDEAGAMAAIAGYTIIQDLSAREFQLDVAPAQTSFGKSSDQFMPMGPWIVTADEIGDPGAMTLECYVNGRLVQRDRAENMIFPVGRLISHISRYATLEPGDIIATGTPAGSGAFRDPPVFLQDGDVLRSVVDPIGAFENRIIRR